MADDDSIINIILRFLVDKQSQQAATASVDQVTQGAGTGSAAMGGLPAPSASYKETWAAVNDYAKSFNVSTAEAAKNIVGMASAGGKNEQQILADVDAYNKEADATGSVVEGVASIDKTVQKTSQSVNVMASMMTGRGLMRVGQMLTQMSQQVLNAPINDFIKQMGEGDSTSAAWLNTQKYLEQSISRMGGTMIKDILPAFQQVAKLAGQVADMMEKNPDIAKAAVVFGVGAAALGQMSQIVGGMVITVSVLKRLGIGAALSGAVTTAAGAATGTAVAGGMGLATLVATVAPLAIAIAVGWFATHAITLPGQKQNVFDSGTQAGGQLLSMAAGGLGELFGQGNQWFLAVGKALGVLSKDAQEAAVDMNDAAHNFGLTNDEMMQAARLYIDEQKAEADATKKAEADRVNIITDAEAKIAKDTADFEKSRADTIAKAAQEDARADQDYYDNRSRIVRDAAESAAQDEKNYEETRSKTIAAANLAAQRSEQEHQKRLKQIQEDGQQNLDDLAQARDALGIVQEKRRIAKQISQENDNYNTSKAQAAQDLKITLAEQKKSYDEQRAERAKQLAQTLADNEAEYNKERQRRNQDLQATLNDQKEKFDATLKQDAIDEQKKLDDLKTSNATEKQARLDAYNQQLQDLAGQGGFLPTMQAYYQQYFDAVKKDMQNAMNSIINNVTSDTVHPHAAGGYLDSRTRGYGEEGYEYLLTHSTTTAFEKLAGGKLTQSKLLGLLGGGGSYNDYRRISFESAISAKDRVAINRSMDKKISELFA